MADSITITVPRVTAAVLSPAAVNVNGSYTVTVAVTEDSVTLYPLPFASGEIASGEA